MVGLYIMSILLGILNGVGCILLYERKVIWGLFINTISLMGLTYVHQQIGILSINI